MIITKILKLLLQTYMAAGEAGAVDLFSVEPIPFLKYKRGVIEKLAAFTSICIIGEL